MIKNNLQGKEVVRMIKKADVVVIGGGVTGTAILRELSKYNLQCVLVEKEPDIAIETTKANSAILHAGFDAPEGSLKASMNVAGNRLYHELKQELDLEIGWTGSIVAATNADEEQTLQELLERGRRNGVEGLEIKSGQELRQIEPNLSETITAGLWAPSAGICWPFGIATAFAENAVINGAEIIRECQVLGFEQDGQQLRAVKTDRGDIETKVVVNAAGIHAAEISHLAGDDSFTITPRKGEYILFDKSAADEMVRCVVFPTPTKVSKGVLISTTTHGNTFIGPNANNLDDNEDTSVTSEGMEELIGAARKLMPNLPLGKAITIFAGLRAVADTGDFILGKSAVVGGLVQAAGIQSPGLTSAPAIGAYIASQIARDLSATEKTDYKKGRPGHAVFRYGNGHSKNELIQGDERYGRVICRCETITEGEIVDAIHRPCGARTVDGVKRRTRAGMGRCQGGFCGPRVTQIIARELDIPVSQVRKETRNSYLFYDKDYEDGGNA